MNSISRVCRINLPNNTYAHITGVDMAAQNNDGQYTTCWRIICARRPASPTCSKTMQNDDAPLSEMFEQHHIAPVERYPATSCQTPRKFAGG